MELELEVSVGGCVILDDAWLGILQAFAAELAVGRVSDRGVRSSTDGLLIGVISPLAELVGIRVFFEGVVVVLLGVAEVNATADGNAGVLGESATTFTTAVCGAGIIVAAPGDWAEPFTI